MNHAVPSRFLPIPVIVFALLIASIGVPIAASAQSDVEAPVTLTTIRFVHAVPGAPPIDILIDGEPVAEAVEYGAVTEHVTVVPGEREIQAIASGESDAAPVATGNPSIDEGSAYIITFLGQVGDVGVKVNEVRLNALDPGMARIRFIHASPDAGDLELVISGGDSLFDGVEFEEDTAYQEIDAGTYQLEIRATDDSVLASLLLDAQSGRVFDLLTIGVVADESVTVLPLITNVSPPCSEILGIGSPDDACVRVVNGQPELGDADAAVAGNVIVEALPFGQASAFVPVAAGEDLAISLAPTGVASNLDEPDTYTLRAGQAYDVVVWRDDGNASATAEGNIQVDIFGVDLTPLPAQQARVRLINASGDAGEVDIIVPAIADDPELFSSIGEGNSSAYEVLDEGLYPVEVHYAGEAAAFFETEIEIQSGVAYDIVALGDTADKSFLLLVLVAPAEVRSETATPAVDAPGATPTGMDVSTPETS